jgi:2-haloacid dehalogenase
VEDWKRCLGQVDTLTFDCYGTLIDWKAGLAGSLGEIFGERIEGRVDEVFRAYVVLEAEIESGAHQSYRDIQTETTRRLAERMGWTLPAGREKLLAALLPGWKPFSDTNDALTRLKRRYRLGVLSNIDRDLFAATSAHFSVSFDFVVTAEDAGSYKPSPGHFQVYLRQYGVPERTLHVGQSPFHDGVSAARVGIPFAWINRYGDADGQAVRPLVELPDLQSLADAAEESA